MPRLIVKIKHVKASKSVRGYVNYVATREGVDKTVNLNVLIGKPTKKQMEFIDKMLEESPDVMDSFEYEDYILNPTKQNASALITVIAESNPELFDSREQYLNYIATRPNVEKVSEHGLFGKKNEINLAEVKNEIADLNSVIWTPIVSLQREDAYRLGYDNADMWRDLIRSKQLQMAEIFGIPANDFNWYGAFHNEAGHPHLHMVVYSTGSKRGFITEEKIEKIKSMLANEIFKNDMYELYDNKTQAREKISDEIKARLKVIAERIRDRDFSDSEVCDMLKQFSEKLKLQKGKKLYGYLPSKMKKEVDEIFKKISEDDDIQEMYKEWCDLQTQLLRIYHDKEIIFPELYENEEFRKLKNAIVKEADLIGKTLGYIEEPDAVEKPTELDENDEYSPIELTTKSSQVAKKREPDLEVEKENKVEGIAVSDTYICDYRSKYRTARWLLYSKKDYEKAFESLKEEAKIGNVPAILDLAKMYQSGLFVNQDDEMAERLFKVAHEGFETLEENETSDFYEYQIAKLYAMKSSFQNQREAIKWFELSAKKGNSFAMFSLANIYFYGNGTEQDIRKAFEFYNKSAKKGCTHSYYRLAEMYRKGLGCDVDVRLAGRWYAEMLKFYSLNPDKRDSRSDYRIGRLYEKGWGTDADINKAKKYYLSACRDNNADAEFAMARINYREGNEEECLKFVELAEEHGNEHAREWYENVKAYQNQYYQQTIIESTAQLFCRLATIIENDTDKKTEGFNKTIVDSKERKRIIKKKQSLGIKMG